MENSLFLQFENAVAEYTDAVCVVEGDKTYNYQEMYQLVKKIHHDLVNQSVRPGDIVAIYSHKSLEAIAAFIAISSLGATCITLDLAFPNELLGFILQEAQVCCVLAALEFPLSQQVTTLELTSVVEPNKQYPTIDAFKDDHIAWLVYSSGTTGKPKGVKLSAAAMMSSFYSRAEYSSYTAEDKVACNIYFFWEAFRPLLFGACVHVVKDALLFDLPKYLTYIKAHEITETLWTPSFAELFFSNIEKESLDGLASLKRVWLNGEVVSSKLSETLITKLPATEFHNLYSISETFDVSAHRISHDGALEQGAISIGFPLPGVNVWVLDNNFQPCQVGEVGELYLTSPSIANGYLNREEAQAKTFLKLTHLSPETLYKTNDAGFIDQKGEVFVIGRNDHIVKLRGYNVSLLAIEDTLKRALPINQCLVKLVGDNPMQQSLLAALEPKDEQAFRQTYKLDDELGISPKLQGYLSSFLPTYAIPNFYAITNNFKLDSYSAKLNRKTAFKVEASDPLLNIWQSIFNLNGHQLTDLSDFFELGGNSLQAIQMIHQLNQKYGLDLAVKDLMGYSTIAKQRELICSDTIEAQRCSIDLNNETIFPKLPKPSSARCTNITHAKSVFVTGATGFLGAHWLAEALQICDAHFYCLVRSENEEAGLKRLQDTFINYHYDPSLLNERISIVTGSLCDTNLGLDEATWLQLTNQVDMIFHAAAKVNLLYGYQELKSSIVDGTKEILKLAVSAHLKPVILISSNAVFPVGSETSDDFLAEQSFEQLTYGYAQAKWIMEAVLKSVSQKYDLPYLLIRLGNLSPSLDTGVYNKEDANHFIIQAICRSKILPENICIEFSPVNQVALTILQASDLTTTSKLMNISDINLLDAKQLKSILPYKLAIVTEENWLEWLNSNDLPLWALWQVDGLFTTHALQRENAFIARCSTEELSKQCKQILGEFYIHES